MDINNCDCTLDGVNCGVIGCKYHGEDNCCHADGIQVESPSALRKGETFCGTFTPNTQG